MTSYVWFNFWWFETGPDFGRPPSFMRKKLLTVLGESGKASSFIDDILVVKRYASESSHSIPVTSDEESLSKTIKEVVVIFITGGRWQFNPICFWAVNLVK